MDSWSMSLIDSQPTFIDFVKSTTIPIYSELKRVHESGHDASHGGTHDTSSAFLISFLRGALNLFPQADFSWNFGRGWIGVYLGQVSIGTAKEWKHEAWSSHFTWET